MSEAKQFEEIPEDVKQEMLLLFESYSKNELLNKLRSLREKISPGETSVSDSTICKDSESFLNDAEAVGTKSNDTLTCSISLNNKNTNASPENSYKSPSLETEILQSSKIQQSQSVIKSLSGNSGESSSPRYDCVNNSFNPNVFQKNDSTKLNNKTSSEMPNTITEDVSQNEAGSILSNDRNVRCRRKKLVNKMKTNFQNKSSGKTTNTSSASRKPQDLVKLSHITPEANLQSKSRQQRKHSKAESKIISGILTNTKVDTSLTTCNFPDNLNGRNELKETNVEALENINVPLVEIPVAESNINSVSGKNKIINMKSSDLSSVKDENVKLLKTSNVNNSCQINVSLIESSVADNDENADLNKSKISSIEGSDVSPILGKKTVPLIKPSTSDSNINAVTNKNKIISKKSSNSLLIKKNVKLLKIKPCNTNTSIDLKVNPNLQKNKKLEGKSSNKVNSESNLGINSEEIVEQKKLIDVQITEANVGISCQNDNTTSNGGTGEQPLLNSNDNADGDNNDANYLDKVSLNNFTETSNIENTLTLTELKSSRKFVTSSMSLRKRSNRMSKNTETISSVCVKTKIVKTSYSSINTNKQASTLAGQENHDLGSKISPNCVKVSKSPVTSTEFSFNDGVSSATTSKKMNNIVIQNCETVSDFEQKSLNVTEINCSSDKNLIKKAENFESHHPAQNANVTSRLKDKRRTSYGEIKNCEGTSNELQQNAEAYSKLSKLCSLQGLNLDDIFRRKEVKQMIEKYKNNEDAIVFLGTHRCPSTGKIDPVIHAHKSKRILMEKLSKIPDQSDASQA